jgi:hypothetical protein
MNVVWLSFLVMAKNFMVNKGLGITNLKERICHSSICEGAVTEISAIEKNKN